jgi:copper chaperone CopZ
LAIAALAFAWYKSISNKNVACGPDGVCSVEKKSFLASRTFLSIITVLAIAMIAFPYFGHIFYPKPEKQNVMVVESNNIQTASFQIKGMTCNSCEASVNSELSKVPGMIDANTAYAKGVSVLKFDKSKATVAQLKEAIAKT